MRTWRAHDLGEPADVMQLDEVERPVPGPGEVLIDVEAVGLNFPDLLQLRGGYQIKRTPPFGVGGEVAGVVAEVGDGVDGVVVGDRVATNTTGGLAEQAVARADKLLALSDGIPAAKAAAMISNYTTTHYALHDRARLQPGETLFVTAGAGGVGSSAIQLGLAAGARVIATAGGPEKVEVCRRLGAHNVFDYKTDDIVERVRDLTDGDGVDVVYDPVGGDVFDQTRRTVGWNGRYLVIGFTSGRIPDAPMNHVLLKNYSIVGVHWGAAVGREPEAMPRTYATLLELYDRGEVDPLVFQDEAFPLDAAADALTALGNRGTWGKVIVDPTR
jgi:NADPH:quinone reductase